MRDYIEIGPTPADEPCAQVGETDYEERAAGECKRFIALIRKTLGPEPEGARLVVRANNHDFGVYYNVVCRYDDSFPDAVSYAFRAESEAPARWSNPEDIDGAESAARLDRLLEERDEDDIPIL